MWKNYWTPSRCAKILIDKDATDLPADLFIYVKGAGCRWWDAAWWSVGTQRRARAEGPPAATTTFPCSCLRPSGPRNLPPHLRPDTLLLTPIPSPPIPTRPRIPRRRRVSGQSARSHGSHRTRAPTGYGVYASSGIFLRHGRAIVI
ncbi:unnamed protein product [Pieris macdunnoughi]|uniref:Uncharacterized protein n=1 Tax=Pieris macdunnoughi TaxID=345717 RepID=A0A821M1L6_9NEOP|nr:unnamed protein product [Pieris macdunnoughi]